jgi:hypothetical protein
MNLESIAKYFAPKSPMLSDSPRPLQDGLTGTDTWPHEAGNAKCDSASTSIWQHWVST